MAAGQLHLALTYDDGRPVPPPMGSVGAELYRAHEPLAWADPEHGWALAHLCEAVGRMSQELDDLIRDSDAGPGWSALLDVDRAPGADRRLDALPWLAQLAGVRSLGRLGDAERREAIRRRGGSARGTYDAIASTAERFTVDGLGVTLRERYDPTLGSDEDAPYRGQVRILRSRLLPGADEAAIERAVLAQVPAGLRFAVVITDDRDYDMVEAAWLSYATALVGAPLYDDLLSA